MKSYGLPRLSHVGGVETRRNAAVHAAEQPQARDVQFAEQGHRRVALQAGEAGQARVNRIQGQRGAIGETDVKYLESDTHRRP